MAKEKNNGLENYELKNQKLVGKYYKTGGKVGRIVCDDESEKDYLVSSNAKIPNESVVEFSVVDGIANIEKVLTRGDEEIIGYVVKTEDGIQLVERTFKGLGRRFRIANNIEGDFIRESLGRVVTAKVLDDGVCFVDGIHGNIGDLPSEIDAINAKLGLRKSFTEEENKERDRLPTEVNYSEINRMDFKTKKPIDPESYDKNKFDFYDLRDINFVTIDPDGAQDFDDSIALNIDINGNYEIFVAISYVPYYINEQKTPHLNDRIFERMFSKYGPYKAEDMNPHEVASGICSLNEGVDRLVLCYRFVVDKKTGKVIEKDERPFQAIINSKKRFKYEEVQEIYDKNPELEDEFYKNACEIAKTEKDSYSPKSIYETVFLAKKAADILAQVRTKNGGLNVSDVKESEFILSEDGTYVKDVVLKDHLNSMKVIEAFMVAGNVFFAEYLESLAQKYGVASAGIFRTHGSSSEEQVDMMNNFCELFDVEAKFNGTTQSFNRIVSEIQGNENADIIEEMGIRCLARATYSAFPHPTNIKTGDVDWNSICHFALALERYCHSTSPIRRAVDHINQYVAYCDINFNKLPYKVSELKKFAAEASAQEKKFDDSYKEQNDLLYADYAIDQVNNCVSGKVCDIKGEEGVVILKTDNGMRVNVPISEFMMGKKDPQKYTISPYGIAIIKDGKLAVYCGQKFNFKISDSDRSFKRVYASLDMTKNYPKPLRITDPNANYRILENKCRMSLESQLLKMRKEFKQTEKETQKRNKRWAEGKGKRK